MTCFRIVGDLRRSLTAARPVLFPELLVPLKFLSTNSFCRPMASKIWAPVYDM